MRKITNPDGCLEWIINEDEKELIDIALHNLAVSTGNASLPLGRGEGYD